MKLFEQADYLSNAIGYLKDSEKKDNIKKNKTILYFDNSGMFTSVIVVITTIGKFSKNSESEKVPISTKI